MDIKEVFPYYYPTTVMFVDDNPRFLRGMSLHIRENLVYRLMDSPIAALQLISDRDTSRPFHERVLTQDFQSDNLIPSSLSMNVDVSEILCTVFDVTRYGEISVAIVDYDMPEMNGLEFCRRISHYGVRKILLTGAADEKIAVNAFNEGIIDVFINKSENDLFRKINQAICKLQLKYFKEMSIVTARAINATYGSCFYDPEFAEYFSALCSDNSIVEYYIMSYPAGFLLIDEHGEQSILLIQTEDEFRQQVVFAREEGAPSALLERLMTREELAFFPNTRGYYDQGYDNWDEYLHPSRKVVADKVYYCAHVKGSPFEVSMPETFIPYKEYLALSDVGVDS